MNKRRFLKVFGLLSVLPRGCVAPHANKGKRPIDTIFRLYLPKAN